MTSVLLQPSLPRASARSWDFALALVAAWLVLCAQLLGLYWAQSAWTMPDADDAMRLVQLREFLAGHGWFDLHEPRLSPPSGYDSHWSRLVDAGLAGLYLLFHMFADGPTAERLMSVAWPMLWLLPAMAATAAIAWRLGGRNAALVALLLAAFCGPGMQQFRPGRIDHHNVQIALSLLVVATTVWSDRSRWACWAAGLCTGVALAIGFESLPFLVLCGAAFALRYIFDREAASALGNYGFALAAGGCAAFLVSVPPSRWMNAVCDMIAINSALPVVIAGLGLAAAGCIRGDGARTRAIAVGAAGAAAFAIFIAIEPRCLGGVYAMVDPAIRPIWLDYVSETKPLIELIRRAGATGIGTAAFPVLAMAAGMIALRRADRHRAFGPLMSAAAFAAAFVYMLAENRGVSYAVWLGMPLVAVAALEAFDTFKWTSVAVRFAVAILLTPTAVTIGVASLASAAGETSFDMDSSVRQTCVRQSNYSGLARSPKGLVAVNELEWGPYVLAWTPHSVLAAPYHRVPAGIVGSHRIFHRPPEEARRHANEAGVDYLVVCGAYAPSDLASKEWQASLVGQLHAGNVPGWLKPLGPTENPAVYRVQR